MNGQFAAASLALLALLQSESPRPTDRKETVRAAYVLFVEHVNALSTSLTPEALPPELIARLQGFDRRSGSTPGLATVSIEGVDVLAADVASAILVASRTAQWPGKPGSAGESTKDSILAALVCGMDSKWRVAYQLVLSRDEKIRLDSSMTSPSAKNAQVTLESILNSITKNNQPAVENDVSRRIGRTLSGEVGSYLNNPKQEKMRWDELNAMACSDDTCILVAKLISLEFPSDSHVAGVRTISRSMFVFHCFDGKSWKLDGEVLLGL
jgi:hypothetical protein